MSPLPLRTPLSTAQLAEAGVPDWPFGIMDQVRFSEIDALNHVNNAVYVSWLEMARVTYLLDYAATQLRHAPPDPQIVIRRQTIDYLAPILFGDTYTVTLKTTRAKPSSMTMEYGIYVGAALKATAETIIVSLTQDGTNRQPWSNSFLQKVVEEDGAKLVGFN